LLRELLAEDGVIFISIDDNEQHRLRMLLDEIFGESNFIACLPTVMNLKGNNDEFGFAGSHEYVLSWAKDKDRVKVGEFHLDDEELGTWLEDDHGYYKEGATLKSTGVNAPRSKRPNLFYPIFVGKNDHVVVTEDDAAPAGSYEKVLPITDGEEMSWRWGKEKVNGEPHNLIVKRGETGISLRKKQRPSIGEMPTRKPKTVFYKPEYSSGTGTAELKAIFNSKVFNNPKPVQLLKDLIGLVTKSDSIVLDSFAGSGTTAHAVLELNKEDGGARKFILVECEDYADTVTARRVRRVIKGVPSARNENLKKGFGGAFAFCKLGAELNIENMLRGKNLPDYDVLARHPSINCSDSATNHAPERVSRQGAGCVLRLLPRLEEV